MSNYFRSEIWKHVKTGRLYTILNECLIEADSTPAVVYKSLYNGLIWVRPKSEFYDGRFVNLQVDGEELSKVGILP